MTTYCPLCSTANRAGSVYCNQCGQPLAETPQPACRACGSAVLAGSRFCQRCGASLPESPLPLADTSFLADAEEGPAESEAPALTLPETDLVLADHYLDQAGGAAREAPSGAEDLLAQLDQALPLTAAPFAPARGAARPFAPEMEGKVLEPTPAAAAFAEMLAEEPVRPVAATEGQRSTGLPGPLITRLLYLVLFGAVVLPFVAPGEWSGSTIPLSGSTAAFYERIYRLTPGAPVLVAFEYDPATQAELDPQSRAVIAHLMRQGARITALSLLPQGPALADSLIGELAVGQGYRYGEDYINLGYLAGEEAALSALGTSIAGAAPIDWREGRPTAGRGALQGVTGVRTYDAVIVLSGDEGSVSRWLGQVAGRYGVQLLAGVSASAVARLKPFEESGQLAAMLVGLPGAAEYELLLSAPGRAVQMLDAQSLAHGVLVVFVLLGNLGVVASSLASRRAGSKR